MAAIAGAVARTGSAQSGGVDGSASVPFAWNAVRTKATSEAQARRKATQPGGAHWQVISMFVDEDFLPPPVAFSEVRNRVGRGGVQSFDRLGSIFTFFGRDTKKVKPGHGQRFLPMPVPYSEVRNRIGTGGR